MLVLHGAMYHSRHYNLVSRAHIVPSLIALARGAEVARGLVRAVYALYFCRAVKCASFWYVWCKVHLSSDVNRSKVE